MASFPASARRRLAVSIMAAVTGLTVSALDRAWAQDAAPAATAATPATPAPSKKRRDTGSPIDTIRNTRLWTDVPPAEGFVRDSRPDPKTLDYTPLTGVDPVRPKPRDAANVQALQAELERDGRENAKKAAAFGRKTASAADKPKHRKPRSSPAD